MFSKKNCIMYKIQVPKANIESRGVSVYGSDSFKELLSNSVTLKILTLQ